MTTIINTHHWTEFHTQKTTEELDQIWRRLHTPRATPEDRAFQEQARAALCGGSEACPFSCILGERPRKSWTWAPTLDRWERPRK